MSLKEHHSIFIKTSLWTLCSEVMVLYGKNLTKQKLYSQSAGFLLLNRQTLVQITSLYSTAKLNRQTLVQITSLYSTAKLNVQKYTCKYNVSVNNTTLYFVYSKNSILSVRRVSTFIRSSSGPLGKQIQEPSSYVADCSCLINKCYFDKQSNILLVTDQLNAQILVL